MEAFLTAVGGQICRTEGATHGPHSVMQRLGSVVHNSGQSSHNPPLSPRLS